jgi:hypothetical protein
MSFSSPLSVTGHGLLMMFKVPCRVIGMDKREAGRMLTLSHNGMELQILTYAVGRGARHGSPFCNLLAPLANEGVKLSSLQGRQTV